MKIKLLQAGKTEDRFLQEGILLYEKRLQHYASFQPHTIPALKNTRKLSQQRQKEKEGVAILESLQPTDHVVLLDENGKQLSSVGFSTFLENTFNRSVRTLVFVIGGPYGFSAAVYELANHKINPPHKDIKSIMKGK